MRRLVLLVPLVCSACLEGSLVHFTTDFTHQATCKVSAGVETCFDPGPERANFEARMSIEDRGPDTRVFLQENVLVGTYSDNVFNAGFTRDQVREASGCLTRAQQTLEGVVDDPGFGIRRESRGTLVVRTTTEGDPQQCGANIPFGDVKKYHFVAVEVFNP